MADLNKVILMGHMTADPELKQTPSGVSVCSFGALEQATSPRIKIEHNTPISNFFIYKRDFDAKLMRQNPFVNTQNIEKLQF